MAITSAISTSFKVEILKAVHNFTNGGNAFNCALFKALASQTGTYGAATTSYTDMTGNSDELPASGNYTTKGFVLTNTTPTSTSTTAHLTFTANASWTTATFTTRGCMIFNDTASGDPSVMVINFGADYSVSGGTFEIQWPVNDSSNAILRIA